MIQKACKVSGQGLSGAFLYLLALVGWQAGFHVLLIVFFDGFFHLFPIVKVNGLSSMGFVDDASCIAVFGADAEDGAARSQVLEQLAGQDAFGVGGVVDEQQQHLRGLLQLEHLVVRHIWNDLDVVL